MTAPELRSQVLLRSEESGGHVAIVDNTVAARAKGPPLHKHDFDEAFYMTEGELVFQIEDRLLTARRGEVVFAPRNVPHALTNRSDEPARYMLVCTPAGLERQFARMAAEQAGEEPPDWALQPVPEVIVLGAQIDADGSFTS